MRLRPASELPSPVWPLAQSPGGRRARPVYARRCPRGPSSKVFAPRCRRVKLPVSIQEESRSSEKRAIMSEPIWNQFLTERDKAVFATSGYGARGGFGKRPALLVIDVNWAFCGDKPEPIL